MRCRLTTLALAATLTVAILPAAARADGSGFGYTDGESVEAGAEAGGGSGGATPDPTGGGGGTGTGPRCEYARLDESESEAADGLSAGGWGSGRGAEPGAWYRRICYDERGLSTATVVWITDADPVDPAALAQHALDRAPLPLPVPLMSPPAERGQVVNVETLLWVDPDSWRPISASASAGAVTVTTTATPVRVIWDMGNGDTVTCDGPGEPYDPAQPATDQGTGCAYTYRRSSATAPAGRFEVSATVVWGVGWAATGADGGGDLGPVTRTTTVSVRVAEIQAVNR